MQTEKQSNPFSDAESKQDALSLSLQVHQIAAEEHHQNKLANVLGGYLLVPSGSICASGLLHELPTSV